MTENERTEELDRTCKLLQEALSPRRSTTLVDVAFPMTLGATWAAFTHALVNMEEFDWSLTIVLLIISGLLTISKFVD